METTIDNMIPELDYYIHRKCTSNWKIIPFCVPFVDITYCIAGKARYFLDDKEYVIKKGDLLCIPYGTHRMASSIPEDLMECYSINFFLKDKQGNNVTLPIPLLNHIGISTQLISYFHEIHEELLKRDFCYKLKVQANIYLILHHILVMILNDSQNSNKDARIIDSIHYISNHFAEDLSVETMAKLFHIHPNYYGNLFKKTIGITFKQYLNSLRLNHAENMLKNNEGSVGDIALQSGFSDIYYFSKLFKEKKGISPSKLLSVKTKKCTDNIILIKGKELV